MWISCILAAVFAVAGIILHCKTRTYRFLGLVCYALAAVSLIYGLLSLLPAPGIPMLIFSILLCAGCTVYGITELCILRASRGAQERSCPYVIVLGAGLYGQVPSPSLRCRIQTAAAYLTRHPDSIAILSGGKGADEHMSEAAFMRQQLRALGISEDRLWTEESSTSTWENFRFSLSLIEEKTGKRLRSAGLITSEYHLLRAGMFARKCGIRTFGIPAHTENFAIRLNGFLREGAGIWHYIILGGTYRDRT